MGRVNVYFSASVMIYVLSTKGTGSGSLRGLKVAEFSVVMSQMKARRMMMCFMI